MRRSLISCIKLFLVASILTPLSTLAQIGISDSNSEIYKYPSQERIERKVDSIFKTLSTREKIAQIMVINFTSKESKDIFKMQKRLVSKEKIGGLIPLGDVYVPAIEKLNTLHKLAKIPMLITLDAEWGASMRWSEIPDYQLFLQLGALSDDSLVYEVGKSIAQECRALKIQVNYSPCVDLNNNPERHIVNIRSFGENKYKVARFASAMMHGLQDGGVATCAKHFPGHGDTDVDSHVALPILPYTTERLDTLELFPFKHLINDGIDMVMVGHMSIKSLDSTGTPSSISKPIVTGLLREKLGFNGIICTDALDMHGVSKESGLEKKYIPLAAYKAGIDILLMPEEVESSITVIENALKNGEITIEGLDMRVKKMLALKARLGLFEKGYDPIIDMEKLHLFTDMETKDGIMEKKLDLIKRVSKETMTVVFNDNSAGFGIPVSFEGKRVAYVGFKNPKLGYEFGVIANRYGNVDTILLGNNASVEELKRTRERLKNHDLIIFGFNETNQRMKQNYGIVKEEAKYITDWAAEQPMIAVYLGSPYAITQIPGYRNFTSYIVGYFNNQVNNFAAAQLVFGGIPAKGVLPVTSGSYKEGESVIIPYRYREEYHHYIGSKDDSLNLIKYEMKEMSPAFTLLPQVAELVAGGKMRLTDRVCDILVEDNANMSVETLLKGYKNSVNANYLKALIGKYRKCKPIEEVAAEMAEKMGMRNTTISENVVTTGYDLNKYYFTLRNGGKYEGKEVMSPQAAELVLKFIW
ncbi:MAG: glycoside hydrolase family 3 protein [Bacteroidales bacterium]|nr:glycoside hydrolase family 3 protein [Bacteroidales bacterium]